MSCVSVIIPNYNREALVGQTIANLLKQSRPPAEIIVIDDGSTDGSLAVIRSFGPSIRLIQQKNQGPGAARNAGLKIATGNYIQFQDSDDLLSLNKLEVQAKELEATGADLALGPWAHVLIHNQKLSLQTCVLQQALPPTRVSLPGWLLRGWFTVFQSLLFRRTFLVGAGCFETDVRYGEDMEFLFRILAREHQMVFTPETLMLYRVNSANNLSSDGGATQNRRIVDWARCLERIGNKQNEMGQVIDSMSRSSFLAIVRKHLRYLRAVPDLPPGLVSNLSDQVARLPEWHLRALELWQRLTERLRLLRSGNRWMPGLQVGPLVEQQRRLIAELGFKLSD